MTAAVCTLDYSQPGKPPIDWDDPAAREKLVSDLVNDALAVLAGPGAPQREPGGGRSGPAGAGRGAGRRAGGRILTGRTGGGGSPGRWPRTG